LAPHQKEAVEKLANGRILKGGVGTGKSRTALAYFADAEVGQHLYIITTARKRDSEDWNEEARAFGIFAKIDSWNNLAKYEDVKGAFFIFDEQRVVGSGVWVKAFLQITKQNNWILLSATPGDTWLDYIPVFIANGFYKSRADFVRQHVVFSPWTKFPKVERYLEGAKLQRLLKSILVEMPFERATTRHLVDVFAEYDIELYKRVTRGRWNHLEERPIRHVSELFSLMRRVVNSHPSRLERVRDLMIKHPKLIVFYNFDYELEILKSLSETTNPQLGNEATGGNSGSIIATAEERGYTSTIPSTLGSFAVAEWNGHKHEPIPDTESWIYLVQYAAGAEAWNCVETDAMIFYSLQYSYRIFEQAQGRIDRLNTEFADLWYYVLKSDASIDRGISQAIANKKDFNEAEFLRTRG
jgi:hypothetical protein